jgi:hypothetical protein
MASPHLVHATHAIARFRVAGKEEEEEEQWEQWAQKKWQEFLPPFEWEQLPEDVQNIIRRKLIPKLRAIHSINI